MLVTSLCMLLCSLITRVLADVPLITSLPSIANVTGFGQIAFRGPVASNTDGPVIVLYHGIYGGASFRAWNPVAGLLDTQGARVYVMDLPGIGTSDSPQRVYSPEVLEAFFKNFVLEVVAPGENVDVSSLKVTIVAESTTTMPALSSVRLLKPSVKDVKIVLSSPTGINVLSSPPSASQNRFFNQLYSNDSAGTFFYTNILLGESSIIANINTTFYDPSLITQNYLDEFRIARQYPSQKWISFAFVGGLLAKPFRTSYQGISKRKVLMIFGANQVPFPVGGTPGAPNVPNVGKIDAQTDFAAIEPDFNYLTIDKCASVPTKEKPVDVANAVFAFAK